MIVPRPIQSAVGEHDEGIFKKRKLIAMSEGGEVILSQNIWGGRMVQWCCVNFQWRGILLIWIIVWQGHTALAQGGGGGCLDLFSLSSSSLFFLPLTGSRPDKDRNTVSQDR